MTRVQANGIRAAGQKFFTLSADPRSIYGKKQVCGIRLTASYSTLNASLCFQADGIILVKTKQAVLVAEYVAPIQAAEATPIVERLGDYLLSVGY